MFAIPCTQARVSFSWGRLCYWGPGTGCSARRPSSVCFAVRAVREERVLLEELEGYGAYMARVKCRFFPGVW